MARRLYRSVAAARRLLASAVSNHLASEQARTAAPAVTAVRGHVEDIVAREVAAAERRYTPEVAAAVRDSLHRVTGSLLHVPSQRATIHARSGHLDDYLAGVLTVFGIEVLA